MKNISITFGLFLMCLVQGLAQTEQARKQHYNLEKSIALDGYDPVSYLSGKPAKGKSNLTTSYIGITYNFVSEQNLSQFKSDPSRYEPAYGGWCAYAMGETGEKVKVDPETFKILDGRLYLFYNFWGNNTLEDWNKNEKSLKSKADNSWKVLLQ